MDDEIRQFVRQRANNRCEYCLLPQEASPLTFHLEHIIARQHLDGVVDAMDDPDYLALACDRCNAYKGTNLTSIDPDTRAIVLLYHPRQDVWAAHFILRGSEISGLTPVGRATVKLLQMNAPQRVELREEWIQNSGEYL